MPLSLIPRGDRRLARASSNSQHITAEAARRRVPKSVPSESAGNARKAEPRRLQVTAKRRSDARSIFRAAARNRSCVFSGKHPLEDDTVRRRSEARSENEPFEHYVPVLMTCQYDTHCIKKTSAVIGLMRPTDRSMFGRGKFQAMNFQTVHRGEKSDTRTVSKRYQFTHWVGACTLRIMCYVHSLLSKAALLNMHERERNYSLA